MCIRDRLEPCCHYGKTPPCTEAIIKSGITRVVVGTLDCNPIVSGKGVKILEKNNIQVDVGILEKECQQLIKVFRKYVTKHIPYVFMKYAMTLDGKIATYTNQSKWVSGEEARKQVHQLRHKVTAIMVGVNTVIQDNPLLTCRLENGKNPIRIVDVYKRQFFESRHIQRHRFLSQQYRHRNPLRFYTLLRFLHTGNAAVTEERPDAACSHP